MIRKFVIGFLVGIVLATGLLFGSSSVNAQWLTFDASNLAQMIAELGENIARWIAEDLWAVLRDQAVKRIIDTMTDDVVNAINNGGEPLFVSDWQGFVGRAADITFDEFNNYLEDEIGLDLCSPIRPQLQIYLSALRNTNRLGLPPTCTISRFKQNVEDSYERLIERNGWISFAQMFGDPSNNFFGATVLLDDGLMRQMSARSQARENEATASSGFLSQKKCVVGSDDPNTTADECEKWEVITPGDIAAEAATKSTLRDFPYIENVQSIISAIVDSIITDVFSTSDGGGFLDGAGGSGGGITFDSGNEDDLIDKLREVAEKWSRIISYMKTLISDAEYALSPIVTPPENAMRSGTILDARQFCWHDDGANGSFEDALKQEHFGHVRYKNEFGTRSYVRLGIDADSGIDFLRDYFNDILSGVNEGLPVATSTLERVQDWIQLYEDEAFEDGYIEVPDGVDEEGNPVMKQLLLLEIVSTELNELNDFVSKYSFAGEAISSSGTAGPGNLEGTSSQKTKTVMENIIFALRFGLSDDLESEPMGWPEYFFYCKNR